VNAYNSTSKDVEEGTYVEGNKGIIEGGHAMIEEWMKVEYKNYKILYLNVCLSKKTAIKDGDSNPIWRRRKNKWRRWNYVKKNQ